MIEVLNRFSVISTKMILWVNESIVEGDYKIFISF